MEHGFGWLPRHDVDNRAYLQHRRTHLAAALQKARRDDEAKAELERMLNDVDAAIASGLAEAPEQTLPKLTDRQREALADPCRCPQCRCRDAA